MATKPSLLPEKLDSPQQLLKALNSHDWDYGKSDDYSEWRRGCDDSARIIQVARQIPNGEKILEHYAKIRSLIDYGHE